MPYISLLGMVAAAWKLVILLLSGDGDVWHAHVSQDRNSRQWHIHLKKLPYVVILDALKPETASYPTGKAEGKRPPQNQSKLTKQHVH